MLRILDIAGRGIFCSALTAATLAPLACAHAKGYGVLYSFTGGGDGGNPYGGVIVDKAGNLYGTASEGGANGYGAVFKLASDGAETVLYSFKGGADGSNPNDDTLIMDTDGNLYGTTSGGDANDYGTVFKLAANGAETVLYAFKGGSDGAYPAGGVILDKKGNLYGTTTDGGVGSCDANGVPGCGVVFEVAPKGTESVLYAFTGGSDGGVPDASLIMDKKGNLYSTTVSGGVDGDGVVFELTHKRRLKVIYSFTGGSDGANPLARLIEDAKGDFYSTAEVGGSDGYGTVFKLTPAGKETVVYSFTGGSDGANPTGSVLLDKKGDVYGTAYYGGYTGAGCSIGCGTVFKVAPNGTESVLHAFTGGTDGAHPYAGLANEKSQLFGTTVNNGGGSGYGTVFRLKE